MRSITSDEVNFLILRYLQESGFRHSSFTFAYESLLYKSQINYSSEVPPGSLISFIQKGIQYLELENKLLLKENGEAEIEYNSPFELVVPALKKKISQSRPAGVGAPSSSTTQRGGKKKKTTNDSDAMEMDEEEEEREQPTTKQPGRRMKKKKTQATPSASGAAEKNTAATEEEVSEIPSDKVTVLQGHKQEVFICAWSPVNPNVLASGSGDSTARIWSLGSKTQSLVILPHSESKDVTTLDWSGNGNLLATGSYDGKARIWTVDGVLQHNLEKHKGPIFSLKFNKKGDYLLSGSVDNTAIVWDVATGTVKQQFNNHTAPTLDVDWRTDLSFATCSTDKNIYVCKIDEEKPLRVFQGHDDEVNAIRWDPSGTLLASCSDDHTAKIWSLKSDAPLFDLKEHNREIYTIKWSPTGPNTNYPNKNLVLASASFDATVKIWDIHTGKCKYSLTKHTEPVYSVSFSPDGEYLASGSFDRSLHIWSVKDGKLVKTFKGNGSIFEVCWNSNGTRVAACFSNSNSEEFNVSVIDFRM